MNESLILNCPLHLGLPSGLFPSLYRAQFFYSFPTPMYSTRHTHLVLLDTRTLVIFCKFHTFYSCSIHNFFLPPNLSPISAVAAFSAAPFPKNPSSLCRQSSAGQHTKVSTYL